MSNSADVPAGPPAGWYLDPNGIQVLRWWDGRQWGSQTQPLPAAGPGSQAPLPAAQPSAAPGPWAWAVSCTPLLLLGVAALIAAVAGLKVGVSQSIVIGGLIAVIFAIFAASRDTRALRAAGEPVGGGLAWWCLLVPWAYLWARAVKRTAKSGADWGILAAAVVVWLVVVVIAVPVTNSAVTTGETFNQAQVQADIAKGIKAQTGVTVTVSCPKDPPLNTGSKFQCVATAANGSTTLVDITIQDQSGDYIWQTEG